MNLIVFAFVFFVKFNSFLMIDNLFFENRINFIVTIINAQRNFDKLCEIAAMIVFNKFLN